MQEFACIALTVAALLKSSDCHCYPTTLYANTYSQSKSVHSSTSENCRLYIKPMEYLRNSSYYLELSWLSSNFEVKGNMPLCMEDYIEVFLTRNYSTIGKFCSNNAEKPFTMFSFDGYAKITYRANGYSTGMEFTFRYKLKSMASNRLGALPSSSTCYNTYNQKDQGLTFSTGWPSGYQNSSSSCDYRIKRQDHYYGIYIVFMDISLNDNKYPPDCIQLNGYNNSYLNAVALSTQLWNNVNMLKYVSYDKYLTIHFDRKHGSGSSFRGFVAGSIMFKKPVFVGKPNSNIKNGESYATVHIVIGVMIPGIFSVIILSTIVLYPKRQQQPNIDPLGSSQTQNTAIELTIQQVTSQETTDKFQAMPNLNDTCSVSHCEPPTTAMQIESYFTRPYILSYPPTASDTDAQLRDGCTHSQF